MLGSRQGVEGVIRNEAAEGVVGDEGRGVGQGQFGNWAGTVAGVQPLLNGGAIEGVAGGEDNGVGHYLQGNGAFEIGRQLDGHSRCC